MAFPGALTFAAPYVLSSRPLGTGAPAKVPSAERKTRCGMNRWMSGGVALGIAAAGTLVFAGTGSAQEADLEAGIGPTEIAPDEGTEIFSVDPCLFGEDETPGRLTFLVTHPDGSTDDLDGPEDLVADPDFPEDDGHWAFTISLVDEAGAPVPFDPGAYSIQVTCTEDQVDPETEPPVVGEYNLLSFTVVEGSEPTTPAPGPTTPTPAPPVVRTPDEGTG